MSLNIGSPGNSEVCRLSAKGSGPYHYLEAKERRALEGAYPYKQA